MAALQPWSRPVASAPVDKVARADISTSAVADIGPVALDPARFADGSCMAFLPTSGDRHQTVFVDAGHGGPDPGATGNGIKEKNVTLPVALDAAGRLRAMGYRVVLSRTADSPVVRLTPADVDGALLSTTGDHNDVIARVTCANLAGAAALVSIHVDAYPSSSVRGATTLYDADRPFSSANHTLAADLQHQIIAALAAAGWQVHDRGVADDTHTGGGEITAAGNAYGHLALLGPAKAGHVDHPSTMPGAVVEPLFLTNPTEAAMAVNPKAQQAMALGIANAVAQFLRRS
ncbi:MAG TPA: N-acetylmuramoyl-L-alanine amidase [Pseudonocardiaceae bacterium]|nr:N-acetylmuramoyl-L-alanine amidase [Pseudonocardiaceae bacterium]